VVGSLVGYLVSFLVIPLVITSATYTDTAKMQCIHWLNHLFFYQILALFSSCSIING
jgi:hypothetical protein